MIMRRVVILGSTGSIGTTCLNYLRKNNPDITAITQKKMTIIGDKETRPVRKHGIPDSQL